MTDKSPLEAEATGDDTATFEFFDREWTVPSKRRLSHMLKMRDALKGGFGDWNLLIAETYLSPEQFADLCEIDPDVDDTENGLPAFAEKISEQIVGAGGNSRPS